MQSTEQRANSAHTTPHAVANTEQKHKTKCVYMHVSVNFMRSINWTRHRHKRRQWFSFHMIMVVLNAKFCSFYRKHFNSTMFDRNRENCFNVFGCLWRTFSVWNRKSNTDSSRRETADVNTKTLAETLNMRSLPLAEFQCITIRWVQKISVCARFAHTIQCLSVRC